MAILTVQKTLVIGLGSTGTEICDALAGRMDWQLGLEGNIKRAPWVQFICIESDQNKGRSTEYFKHSGFYAISINPSEFASVRQHPENYEDDIALSRWANIELLRDIPAKSVTEGAGHNRMVGRLALLYPKNFNKIKVAIQNAIDSLKELTESQAQTRLSPVGQDVTHTVRFAVTDSLDTQEPIRVIVAGTLAGGTASGTLSDLAIMIRSIVSPAENLTITGIFSIPHWTMDPSTANNAFLRKTNVYHALVELNHYSLTDNDDRYLGIKYPFLKEEQLLQRLGDSPPYDLIYLVAPKKSGPKGIEQLNRAMADRVFLNIFSPRTDPMAELINGVYEPRDGFSHIFSTFGLSTIEYPARQVAEGCKFMLLERTLKEWKKRPYPEGTGQLEGDLSGLKLTAEEWVQGMTGPDGVPVRTPLMKQAREIKEAAKKGRSQAMAAYNVLLSAFNDQGSGPLKGIGSDAVRNARASIRELVLRNLKTFIAACMTDYQRGPVYVQQVLDALPERLSAMSIKPAAAKGSNKSLETIFSEIERAKASPLLQIFKLTNATVDLLLADIDAAITREVDSRLREGFVEILNTVTTDLIEEIKIIQKRFNNLGMRIDRLHEWAEEEARRRAIDAPNVNGRVLFEPLASAGGEINQGTVAEEYRKHAGTPEEQDKKASDIIALWSELADWLMPERADGDWLLEPYMPETNQELFPKSSLDGMFQKAESHFRKIYASSQVDVVNRLYSLRTARFDPDNEARAAASMSKLFLEVDETLGKHASDQPIMEVRRLLGSRLDTHSGMYSNFKDALSNWLEDGKTLPPQHLEDPFRIIMLEESHKFSLRGCLQFTQDLMMAESSQFRGMHHTRRDIEWTPLRITTSGNGSSATAVAENPPAVNAGGN